MKTVDELRVDDKLARQIAGGEPSPSEVIVRLRLEIEKLRAALIPFAEAAKHAEPDEKDSYSLGGSSARHGLTLGDLRRARIACQQKQDAR